MSTENTSFLFRGINRRGTRMIRVEIEAANSREAERIVRQNNPDAGALACISSTHSQRVLDQLASKFTTTKEIPE